MALDGPHAKGDLIIEVQCVIETVTKFVLFSKNRNVEISASDRITHSLPNGKQGTLVFTAGDTPSARKNKLGELEVVVAADQTVTKL